MGTEEIKKPDYKTMIGIKVALLGRGPKNWKSSFSDHFDKVSKEIYGGDEEVIIMSSPSMVSLDNFDPEALKAVSAMDLIVAQDAIMVQQADVIVYSNDSVWGKEKKKVFAEMRGKAIVIVWTPIGVSDNPPDDQFWGFIDVRGSVETAAGITAMMCAYRSHS